MRLHIDNGDGKGLVDYIPALLMSAPLTVRRSRERLATCSAGLDVLNTGLPEPVDRARVQVLSDSGQVLFSGFVSRAPLHTAAAVTSSGAWQPVRMEAVEDAWLSPGAAATALVPVTSAMHTIDLNESTVRLHEPGAKMLALRASDVTVTGAVEATSYMTELFQGDGTTASFTLTDVPFHESGVGTLLTDSFDREGFNARVWQRLDPGGYIGLGSGGLSVTGGNGLDGQTVLRAVTPVEMGGSLTAELADVQLQAGSDGVLLGMYRNIVTMPNCFTGFRVKGTAGAQTIVALVNGAEQGTSFTFAEGHRYTLRLRLHCAEMQRVPESYQVVVAGAVQTFTADLIDAPMQVVFEIEDLGLASSTVATVLYAGAVASSPARCVFAAVNSVDLLCEAGSCSMKQSGSAWVVSTLPDGTVVPRREGATGTGADFQRSGAGLVFFPGRVPVANERVTVTYRRGERSSAWLQDAAALAEAATLGLPGLPTAAWQVRSPVPRSSADCRLAAQALLAFAADPASGITGESVLVNPTDAIVPGDRLLLPFRGANPVPICVESVVMQDGHAVPEVLTWTVRFAQDRANALSFTLGEGTAEDVPLPVAVSSGNALASLPGLQVVAATDAALQVDAGTIAPGGGGFEVRRRDGGFGSSDADLVLQSPVRSFSIPRAAFHERFYVRMYDGSSPPVYSERSSVIVTHLPVG